MVKELHEEGIIEQKFGKALPLIIQELEYYDLIEEQNKRANPEEVIKEFAAKYIFHFHGRFKSLVSAQFAHI